MGLLIRGLGYRVLPGANLDSSLPRDHSAFEVWGVEDFGTRMKDLGLGLTLLEVWGFTPSSDYTSEQTRNHKSALLRTVYRTSNYTKPAA